jgi:tetratricopeptide (TPR) repeat protein
MGEMIFKRNLLKKNALFFIWVLFPCFVLILAGCQPKEVTSAKIYIQSNNWDKAVEQLELAVEAYPNNAEAHYLLGRAYGRHARYKDMIQEFNKSLNISDKFEPEITAVREKYWIEKFNLAIKAMDRQDFQQAEKLLKTAVLINPNKYEASKKLAIIYLNTGALDKSLAIYERLLEKTPNDLGLLLSLGNLYYSMKNYGLAVQFLKKVLEVDPDHRDALANLALSYDALNRTDEAFEAYQRAVEANPLDKDLIFLFGAYHYKHKNYQQAIQLFEQVLQLNPADFEALVNIGNAYLSLAENEKQKLKNLDSNNTHSPEQILQIKNRAILNYKKAIPYLERALELQPNHPNQWRNLAIAYINTGEKEKGEKALLKSEELKTLLFK